MKIFFCADDFGLTKSISDDILECYDKGVINSVGLLANGDAFGYAIKEYKKRPGIRLVTHLNIHEGYPISPPNKVDLLINGEGIFFHSFQSLFISYQKSSKKTREKYREQIRREYVAQIKKVLENTSAEKEAILDSHQHFHILPFIFDIILEINQEIPIAYIRLPDESFKRHKFDEISFRWIIKLLKSFFMASIIRMGKYRDKIREKGMISSDYFYGVLFTNKKGLEDITYALDTMKTLEDKTIEFMFHPGRAKPGDEYVFMNNNDEMKFYFSEDRRGEHDILIDPKLKDTVDKMI